MVAIGRAIAAQIAEIAPPLQRQHAQMRRGSRHRGRDMAGWCRISPHLPRRHKGQKHEGRGPNGAAPWCLGLHE